jgi:hypothetical protein
LPRFPSAFPLPFTYPFSFSPSRFFFVFFSLPVFQRYANDKPPILADRAEKTATDKYSSLKDQRVVSFPLPLPYIPPCFFRQPFSAFFFACVFTLAVFNGYRSTDRRLPGARGIRVFKDQGGGYPPSRSVVSFRSVHHSSIPLRFQRQR